jgi:endonuclease/exonuclease/phosphatase family metal-dependent hydrolase
MKILVYNIAYATGLKGSMRDYFLKSWRYLIWSSLSASRNIGDFIKRQEADVVCLLETDAGSLRNRFRSQPKTLASQAGLPYWWSSSKYGPKSVSRLLPTIRKQHDAVLSRIEGRMIPHYMNHGTKKLIQEFVVDGISLFVIHLGLLRKNLRVRQLEELTQILKSCPRPYLVCGDFNIFRGLGEVQDFLRQNHLTLAQSDATFPSFKPKRTIDLILAGPGIRVKKAGVVHALYSDHLPVWAEIETSGKL